jgi:hypothetical protein
MLFGVKGDFINFSLNVDKSYNTWQAIPINCSLCNTDVLDCLQGTGENAIRPYAEID